MLCPTVESFLEESLTDRIRSIPEKSTNFISGQLFFKYKTKVSNHNAAKVMAFVQIKSLFARLDLHMFHLV